MKCSTMFKRGVVLSLLMCLLLSIAGYTSAVGVQEDFLPDGSGDLLLIHAQSLTDDAPERVERIVTMISALGKVVDYGTPEQCLSVLGEYDYIILYDLREMEREFSSQLRKSDASLMLIGSETLWRYLTVSERVTMLGNEEMQTNGTLTYTFPTGQSYECITSWDRLFEFEPDGYESGSIGAGSRTYPFCAQVAGVRFVPITDISRTPVQAALMQEITQWMWPYRDDPKDYAQFLVLDRVYPFMPAEDLLEIIENVEKLGVPYVISVMPLSANQDYPAMGQFCQVLAYAQSKGATIVLHAPILNKTVEQAEELYELLTDMTNPFIENGVYPVGIEVPLSWINCEPYLTALGRYRTVFVYEDDAPTGFDLDAHTSLISRQGHQLVFPKIDLDQEGISQLQCYPCATYVDCSSDSEIFLRYAQQGKTGENPFMDLREYDHLVWLNDCTLSYQNHTVYLDGVMMSTAFEPVEYDTDFDFRRSALVRFSVDLEKQNRFLLGVVVVMTGVFLASIVYARRRMRKRFLSDQSSKEE